MQEVYKKCRKLKPYKKTGPYFVDQILSDLPITIFPYYYFYPIYWHEKNINSKSNMKKKYPKSYMYHHGYTTHGI